MHGNREKIKWHEEINTNIGTIEMVENTKSGAEEENKANKSETEQTEAHWNMGNKPGTIRKRSRKKWNPYNSQGNIRDI